MQTKYGRTHKHRDSRPGGSFRTIMLSRTLGGFLYGWGNVMREIEEQKTTGNMSLFNKLLKRVRANKGDISCSYCPYNKRENSSYKKDRSWKKHRKSQFRGVR